MQAQEARPPYVTFEVRAEEDRAATVAEGRYVAKDVDYAIITPQGSKDRIEREVKSWFENLKAQVNEGRFPQEWLTGFAAKFDAWKQGREIPLEGTAIVNWPAVSPAQVKALLDAHIRTVEDLAAANEETLQRLGMGGRALKSRAQEWLKAANGTGKFAEQVSALKTENEDLKRTNLELFERMEKMQAALDTLMPKQEAPAQETARPKPL